MVKMEDTYAGKDSHALDLLLSQIYRNSRYDFRDYKRSTLTRRLESRLRAIWTTPGSWISTPRGI